MHLGASPHTGGIDHNRECYAAGQGIGRATALAMAADKAALLEALGPPPQHPQAPEIVAHLEALIARPSVTPDDGGCQQLMMQRLEKVGFQTERMDFGSVQNFWATHGQGGHGWFRILEPPQQAPGELPPTG